MKKLMLVYNPVSGNASFKQRLDEMVWKFQERGCMLYLYRTAKDLHTLPLYIREAGVEGVIAAGGDGTVHGIVNIIVKEELNLPMGIFSSGASALVPVLNINGGAFRVFCHTPWPCR